MKVAKVMHSLRPLTQDDVEHNLRSLVNILQRKLMAKKLKAILQEKGVPANSRTETFMALRCEIENWRWAGVPFYVRTGKRLPARVTENCNSF